jgi:acyl-CoA thioesterase
MYVLDTGGSAMAGFVRATSVVADGPTCEASIDSDWFIWGPFGGYLAALALRAMVACSPQARPATFSCQFLNVGQPGPITIAVERLRRGRMAECLRASVRQGDILLVEAQAWIVAAAFSGIEHCDMAPPKAEKPRELSDWPGFGEEAKSPMWRHVMRRPLPCFRTSGQARMRPRWAC